jgi:hypothetical protein
MRSKDPRSISGRVRAAVLSRGVRAWSTDDFPDMPARAVTAALARLKDEDDLVAIRHGLYWRGNRRSWGMTRPGPMELTQLLVGSKGVGWAGLSAANSLGLTTQVPAVETIAVPGPAPRPIEGIKYVTRSNSARTMLGLSDVSFLEVLSDWDSVIDVSPWEAAGILASAIRNGDVDAAKIAKVAMGESGPTRDRLRVVFELAGKDGLAQRIRGSALPATRQRALAGLAA